MKNCPDPGGGADKPYITEYSVCVGANTGASVQEQDSQDLTKTSTNDEERQKDHKSPSEIPTRLEIPTIEILMFHILGL